MSTATEAILTLPHDTEAELRVAGNCKHYPEQFDALTLSYADFYDLRARAVIEVMTAMDREGIKVNHPSELRERLQRHREFRGDPESVDVLLLELDYVGTIRSHFERDVERIRDASVKRRIFEAADWARSESLNGADSTTILNGWHSALDELRHGYDWRSHFKLVTARELSMMDCQVEYRIPGVMAMGQPLVVGGPKKGMKTSIGVCDLAISIAAGGYFLGYFKVAIPGRVWVITGESGMATIKETCNRICEAAGVFLSDLDIVFCEDLPRFTNPEHIAEMGDIITRESFDVVIADPAGKMMDGTDAGNVFKQYAQLEPITRVCQDNGAQLVLAHHAKATRAQPFEPLDLDDLSWSGFAEHFRQWILLNRREAFEPGSGYHRLWLGVGGSAGHHGLWGIDIDEGTNDASQGREWRVEVLKHEDIKVDTQDRAERTRAAKHAQQVDTDMKAIIATMAKLAGTAGTKTDIKDRSALNTARFNPALAAAIEAGHIIPTTITKANKQTYEAYKLAS